MLSRSPVWICIALLATIAPANFCNADDVQKKSLSEEQLVALRKADDARIVAMRKPQRETLESIFSADLHYAHSNGTVDSKASFVETLTAGKTKYLDLVYEKRDFTLPAPGLALMTGRVRVKVATAESKMDSPLSFLAVWRVEDGAWRFLAWQSCKLPMPTP